VAGRRLVVLLEGYWERSFAWDDKAVLFVDDRIGSLGDLEAGFLIRIGLDGDGRVVYAEALAPEVKKL